MRTLTRLSLLLLAAAAAGCPRKAELPTRPVEPVPVEVREADYAALDAFLAGKKGSVVLVDFWATWCGPCRQRFPHLVDTHTKYAPNGLVCATVSLDEPADKTKVLEFLRARNAAFPNFLLTAGDVDEKKIVDRFGYGGSIPHLALFAKDGRRVWDSQREQLSDREVDRRIEAELAK